MLVSFDALSEADLIVDAVYQGGPQNNAGADPIYKLLPDPNAGGIRFIGTAAQPKFVILTTSGLDIDWPDSLNIETGVFTYYGDNKRAGRELHDTPRRGNLVLRNIFSQALTPALRCETPPVFIFESTGERRNQRFLGLAVPGVDGLSPTEQLVGVWRTSKEQRHQNYRSLFTILDQQVIPRTWLNNVIAGDPMTDAPQVWQDWVKRGIRRALIAPRSTEIRGRKEQTPPTERESGLLDYLWMRLRDTPHDFEHVAAALVQAYLPKVEEIEVTRASRDGGRDATGKYRVGQGASSISIDFAVEAKCYRPDNSVGVRELARLISRLRHRQFGILVTTSYLNHQAYSELTEDRHPIIVLSGREVIEILESHGITTAQQIDDYLDSVIPSRWVSAPDIFLNRELAVEVEPPKDRV